MTTETTLYKPQQAALSEALAGLEPRIDELATQVDGLVVDSETFDDAGALFAMLRAGVSAVERARKKQTGKLNEQKREIDGQFRPLRERLELLAGTVSKELGAYNARVRETQRQVEERAAAERARVAQVEAEAQRATDATESSHPESEVDSHPEPLPIERSIETAPEAVRDIQPVLGAVKRSRTPAGTVTMSIVWNFEIQDPAQLPAEFLRADEVAIGAAVRNGTRSIPGVRIYSEEVARARTR